jgi:hypothetical protein
MEPNAASLRRVDDSHVFATQMLRVGRQVLRVGRMFNGIVGNIELLALHEREVLTFDIPGVGHSLMPERPYRLRTIARRAAGVLDPLGHDPGFGEIGPEAFDDHAQLAVVEQQLRTRHRRGEDFRMR